MCTPTAHTPIEHLLENISEHEFHQYEQIVPSYSAQPNPAKLSFDPTTTCTFVVFDTETTCTGKNAELCQLSAIDERGAIRGVPVKRDRLLLLAITCDCKKLKAVNCEGHASRDT